MITIPEATRFGTESQKRPLEKEVEIPIITETSEVSSTEKSLAAYPFEIVRDRSKKASVAWGTQATMDYKVQVNDKELIKAVNSCSEILGISKSDREQLKKIEERGLTSDIEITLDGEILKEVIEDFIKSKGKNLGLENKVTNIEIGGSPAISAMTGLFLALNLGMPETSYFGNYPLSVQEYVKTSDESLKNLFRNGLRNEKLPGTLSFEWKPYKLMIAEKAGRKLELLKTNGEYNPTLPKSEELLVAIGGLNKGEPDQYIALIKEIKKQRPNANIFIGTNSFQSFFDKGEVGKLEKYVDVLREGDIISMNEAELNQIYQAIYDRKDGLNRTDKLWRLNLKGLGIVHSHAGSIFYLGTGMKKNLGDVLETIIKRATFSATYYYEKGHHPQSFEDIAEYLNETDTRPNISGYQKDFGLDGVDGYKMRNIIAPFVNPETAKSTITGLGAVFDGYLASFLATIFGSCKR